MNQEDIAKSAMELTETKKVLQEMVDQGNPEAWPAFTGLPNSTLHKILEWSVIKDISPEDVLLTVAGIAFAYGKRIAIQEATENASAASNSAQ